MKILMLSWEYPPFLTGGLGRHVAELATALAVQDIIVHIITLTPEARPSPEYVNSNLIVHRVDVAAIEPDDDIYAQARIINSWLVEVADNIWPTEGGFDLIHVHDWLVSFAALVLKRRYKCPIIATLHATEKGRWRSESLHNPLSQAIDQAEGMLAFEAWRIIACSYYMVDDLKRTFHLPDDKLDMIPNGINVPSTSSSLPGELVRVDRALLGATHPIIFSVGRLSYEKGFHVLLGAMPDIVSAFSAVKLVLAGRGPSHTYLHQIVQEMGMTDHVHFVGYISDAERNRFFAKADCAVFPSLYEPFGIVALEAMANDCPVVATNVGGFNEVVQHQQTGILVDPDNAASIAAGVIEILSNTHLTQQYTTQARQVLLEKYHWRRIATETKAVYKRVVDERANTVW